MTATIAEAEAEASPREEFIADLRAMADYLEAHPDLPIGSVTRADVQYSVDVWHPVPDRRAVVEAAAIVIGGEATRQDRGHYTVSATIGRATYQVVSCKPDGEPATGGKGTTL